MKINYTLKADQMTNALDRFWSLSAEKILMLEKEYDKSQGSPVFTVNGKYSTRGWTEWTQGFQYGSAILQYDATSDNHFLQIGKEATVQHMAPHISHVGVHDHGFNNLSTYGNLLRLMLENKMDYNEWEKNYYELALKISGAVQANRWTNIQTGGFIYSFNGPHSLFVDTMRTIRILMVSHLLGHALQGEGDVKINLLERAVQHAKSTADYSVYYGESRDSYDILGRTAHEIIFNVNDGNYRCPNAQQGYSGYTTWSRGLAWAMCGFAEQLELLELLSDKSLLAVGSRQETEEFMLKAATATCDFYIANTPLDGIPYWDFGAPSLHKLGNFLESKADPFNAYEPVDSSAAAIGVQGLFRLARYLEKKEPELSKKYWQAGLTVLKSLLDEPYLSTRADHQGILLHTIYHQPNGWDNKPDNNKAAHGEACMWGDYHLREVALYLNRIIKSEKYYTFFGCVDLLSS